MNLLFTKNPKSWFSQAIQLVTGEPVSHVALQMGDWVLHSNWRGVHAQSFQGFLKQNQVIEMLPVTYVSRQRVMQVFHDREMKPYDLLGIVGFTFHLAMRRYLPWITPKINLLEQTSMDFCVELVQHMLSRPLDSLVTPYQLFQQLKGEHK